MGRDRENKTLSGETEELPSSDAAITRQLLDGIRGLTGKVVEVPVEAYGPKNLDTDNQEVIVEDLQGQQSGSTLIPSTSKDSGFALDITKVRVSRLKNPIKKAA